MSGVLKPLTSNQPVDNHLTFPITLWVHNVQTTLERELTSTKTTFFTIYSRKFDRKLSYLSSDTTLHSRSRSNVNHWHSLGYVLSYTKDYSCSTKFLMEKSKHRSKILDHKTCQNWFGSCALPPKRASISFNRNKASSLFIYSFNYLFMYDLTGLFFPSFGHFVWPSYEHEHDMMINVLLTGAVENS